MKQTSNPTESQTEPQTKSPTKFLSGVGDVYRRVLPGGFYLGILQGVLPEGFYRGVFLGSFTGGFTPGRGGTGGFTGGRVTGRVLPGGSTRGFYREGGTREFYRIFTRVLPGFTGVLLGFYWGFNPHGENGLFGDHDLEDI